MKIIITSGIVTVAILYVTNVMATDRSVCINEAADEYLAVVNAYKETGVCTIRGGRLVALSNKTCACIESGVPIFQACSSIQELCCGTNVDYHVTSTTNNVQTCERYLWNASTNKCSTSTVYRCVTGYYGNPTTASSGCSKCPLWTGVFGNSGFNATVYGTTSGPGTTGVTGCYVPTGTYYDATGTFKLTDNCQY